MQFYQACHDGNIILAKNLLINNPHINISARDEYAFRWACFYGHLEVVKWLLKVRPQINISVRDEFAFK